MRRQPDGRWRGAGQTVVVSPAVLRSRWVESETIILKRMGLSFDAIAVQITRAGRGQAQAITELPSGVTFPPDYQISRQAVYKAFQRALEREPVLAIRELRRLDAARSEEMLMNLQPGVRKGNPAAIRTALKILEHSALIHGYAAPRRHELDGRDGQPVHVVQPTDAHGSGRPDPPIAKRAFAEMIADFPLEQRRELLNLLDKVAEEGDRSESGRNG